MVSVIFLHLTIVNLLVKIGPFKSLDFVCRKLLVGTFYPVINGVNEITPYDYD